MTSALAVNLVGSAKDTLAFQNALLADQEQMREVERDQRVFEVGNGDDIQKYQDLLKETCKVVHRY